MLICATEFQKASGTLKRTLDRSKSEGTLGLETVELVEYLYKHFIWVVAPFSNHWKMKVENERKPDLWAPNICEPRNNMQKTEGLNESPS